MSNLTPGYTAEGEGKGGYLPVTNGYILKRVPEGTPGAVSRVNSKGATVHELKLKKITGQLYDIQVIEEDNIRNEKEDFLYIHLKVDQKIDKLRMPFSSGYSMGFLKAAPNIGENLTQMIEISVSITNDERKNTSSFIVTEQSFPNTLKWYFTKEKPNGLPEPKKLRVNNKDVYDWTEQLAFLKDMAQRMSATLRKSWGDSESSYQETTSTESVSKPPF